MPDWKVITGRVENVLPTFEAESFDSAFCDPPYGLTANKRGGSGAASLNLDSPAGRSRISTGGSGFMGKEWDARVPGPEIWREVLRCLKPGAFLLAFGGTRTYHRLACAIEDAGFEIRDSILIPWIHGQGFPKSANIAKHIDAMQRSEWLDVVKALDNSQATAILGAWKEFSRTATGAGLLFEKSEIETGTNTPKRGSARALVLLKASPESSDASAVIADLRSNEPPLECEAPSSSARLGVGASTTASSDRAISAESLQESLGAMLCMPTSSALQSAWGWQSESPAGTLRGVEALKTWLGRSKSSSGADTAALCAALTDDLKRITLNQSKTFQSYDTTRQTACASAIGATITESTAESLISFTAATLRSKAVDRAAGAEREKFQPGNQPAYQRAIGNRRPWMDDPNHKIDSDTPATDAARIWEGYGTALKPAWEPCIVAMKPLDGTFAANALQHGVAGLNVDGCRIPTNGETPTGSGDRRGSLTYAQDSWTQEQMANGGNATSPLGRWPANVILDEEAAELLDRQSGEMVGGERPAKRAGLGYGSSSTGTSGVRERMDGGGASRFFFTSKVRPEERNLGGIDCRHPTLKPLDLCEYLARLILPPKRPDAPRRLLVPFAGAGSEMIGALEAGWEDVTGIELEEQSAEWARARISAALSPNPAERRGERNVAGEVLQPGLFG